MKVIIKSIAVSSAVFGLLGAVHAAPPGKSVFRPNKSGDKVTAQAQSGDTCGAALKRIGPPGKGLRRR